MTTAAGTEALRGPPAAGPENQLSIEVVRGAPDEYEITALVTALAAAIRRRDDADPRYPILAPSTAAPWHPPDSHRIPGAWSQRAH